MAASKLISPFGSLGDVTNVARRPASVILDKYARIGKRMNKDTIATVKSSDGHILEVSLWTVADAATKSRRGSSSSSSIFLFPFSFSSPKSWRG
ncbi:unnamed protein product [Urochloa humidicola]